MAKENSSSGEYSSTLEDIYELETELKKAMNHHSLLLADCMELQVKSDEIIHKYKFSRLRNAFDFNLYIEKTKEYNDMSLLYPLLAPMFAPQIKKSFYLGNVEELLSYPGNKEEIGEEVKEAREEIYQFQDEVEEERIQENYFAMIKVLLQMLKTRDVFTLVDFNRELELTFFDDIFVNSDYYSFLVHLCQRKVYDLSKIMKHQDTFLDAILVHFLQQEGNQKFSHLNFSIQLNSDVNDCIEQEEKHNQIIHEVTSNHGEREFTTMNIRFVRECMSLGSIATNNGSAVGPNGKE
jgi:hypothetical protein